MDLQRFSQPQRGSLWLRLAIRAVLAALVVWSAVRFGRPLLSLFAPFLLALVAAGLLDAPVCRLQRALGWGRKPLSLLVLLAIFGLAGGGIGLLCYVAFEQLVSLVQNWPQVLTSLQAAMDQIDALFADLTALMPPQVTHLFQDTMQQLMQWLGSAVPEALASLGQMAGDKAMGLPSFLVALVIFVMATYMFTVEWPGLLQSLSRRLDRRALRWLGQVKAITLGAFGGYLKAELLLSVGVFFILVVGFALIGQAYGLLLALGLAVLDFIPIVGAGTVMVPWAFAALFTRDLSTAVSIMAIWSVIALFRRVMEPKFVGDQTGLSPILSLVGIYVGMKVAGVLGMILGPILLLVLLNLAGMGAFRGLWMDLAAACREIAAILAPPQDPGGRRSPPDDGNV